MLLEEYKKYYQNQEVLFEIVKILRGRETIFMGHKYPIRCLKIHNIHFLNENFEHFKFFDELHNIYYSVAYLDEMPMFSFNPEKRNEQMKYFTKDFKKYVKGFDLVLDFDVNKDDKGEFDLSLVYEDTKIIFDLMNEYKLPFSIKFSGKKGFHIVIPWNYIPESATDVLKLSPLIAGNLIKYCNLETLDASIYDRRRMFKCPYSLDINTGLVALPLHDFQFNNFNKEICKPDNIDIQKIRDRGLLLRNLDLGEQKLKDNFNKFMNEVIYEK